MAFSSFPFPTIINHHRSAPAHNYNQAATTTTSPITFCFSYSPSFYAINLNRSFPFKRNSWSGRCRATSPQSEPPPNKISPPSSGVTASLRRFRDSLQIFFAVLFWMSLFFWSSAWDGGNGSGGKRDKGSRFRK